MTQQLMLRAPSGRRLQIDLPAGPGVSNIAASIRFVGGSFGRAFSVGPLGYTAFALKYMSKGSITQRLVVNGREVVVGEAEDGSHTVASLIGDYHELMTSFSGPAPEALRIVEAFKAVKVTDSPEGMTVTPKSATLMGVSSEHVSVHVEGRGTIVVPDPALAKDRLPQHGGAKTTHGEVWRSVSPGLDKAEALEQYIFMLGTARGVAEITLQGNEAESLAWLNDINVAWAD